MKRMARRSLMTTAVLVGTALVLSGCMTVGAKSPSIEVSDQSIDGGTVTIDRAVMTQPGWIVIHQQKDGKPGPVLGHAAVDKGTNRNVTVEIDADNATDTIYAMLHVDSGEMGRYEFPGGDPPVKKNGSVVVVPFSVAGSM